MSKKTGTFAVAAAAFTAVLVFSSLVLAQLIPLYRFRGVQVPVKLKIKDAVLDEGAYDLEFVRSSSPLLYYVRIMRRGKILDVIQGEEWAYATAGDIPKGEEIPRKPTLKMSRNRAESLIVLVFETGMNHRDYPLLRARFELPYEE
jgi:hypothetical protein